MLDKLKDLRAATKDRPKKERSDHFYLDPIKDRIQKIIPLNGQRTLELIRGYLKAAGYPQTRGAIGELVRLGVLVKVNKKPPTYRRVL